MSKSSSSDRKPPPASGSHEKGRPLAARPFHADGRGVRVAVRLTPRAAADRILGVAHDADGAPALKVAVTAAPERGRANRALVELLAKAWKLPKSSITLVAGAADRRKLVEVTGEPAILMAKLESWHAAQHG